MSKQNDISEPYFPVNDAAPSDAEAAPSGAVEPYADSDVKLSDSGVPYTSEKVALHARDRRGLDPREWTAAPWQAGWAIVRRAAAGVTPAQLATVESSRHTAAAPRASSAAPEFYRVEFMESSDENAARQVEVAVQGKWYLYRRGIEVIIPSAHLEVIKNATYKSIRYDEARRENYSVVIQTYPYRLIGEATREEFEACLTRGDGAHKPMNGIIGDGRI